MRIVRYRGIVGGLVACCETRTFYTEPGKTLQIGAKKQFYTVAGGLFLASLVRLPFDNLSTLYRSNKDERAKSICILD